MLRTRSVLCLGSSAQHLLWKPFQMSLWRIRNLSGGGKAVVSTPPMDSWTGDPGNVVNSKVFTDLKIWVCFGTLANRASALNWICWTFSRCQRLGQGGYCNTLWACDSRLLIPATSSSPFHSTERTALGASHVSFLDSACQGVGTALCLSKCSVKFRFLDVWLFFCFFSSPSVLPRKYLFLGWSVQGREEL